MVKIFDVIKILKRWRRRGREAIPVVFEKEFTNEDRHTECRFCSQEYRLHQLVPPKRSYRILCDGTYLKN